MGEIDQTSEAIGRIEAKCDSILQQNQVLFRKCDETNARVSAVESSVSALQTSARTSQAIWGGAGGITIAGIFKTIETLFSNHS